MIERVRHIICLCLFLFVTSCDKDEDIPQETTLAVNLIASSVKIGLGESVTVSILVKNADSLFALSFELHYDPELFNIETASISAGNLFLEPYLVQFKSEGEVSTSVAYKIKSTSKHNRNVNLQVG